MAVPACIPAGKTDMKILLVEDDTEAARYIVKGLNEAGHACDHASDGDTGLEMAGVGGYDVAIIDRMLPKLGGLDIVLAMRDGGDTTPVLILSALGEVDDRVTGLRAGGDDYLAKPYAFSELLARVETLARRGNGAATADVRLTVGDLVLDRLSRKVTREGQQIMLQPREFRLLEYLMRHAGQVVTRTMLLEGVWDYHFDPQTSVVETHISRLRAKIDRPFEVALLQTVRSNGYSLHAPR